MKNIKNKVGVLEVFKRELTVGVILIIPFLVYFISRFLPITKESAIMGVFVSASLIVYFFGLLYILRDLYYILIYEFILIIKYKSKLRKFPLTEEELKENNLYSFDAYSKYLREEIGYLNTYNPLEDFSETIEEVKETLKELFIKDCYLKDDIKEVIIEFDRDCYLSVYIDEYLKVNDWVYCFYNNEVLEVRIFLEEKE